MADERLLLLNALICDEARRLVKPLVCEVELLVAGPPERRETLLNLTLSLSRVLVSSRLKSLSRSLEPSDLATDLGHTMFVDSESIKICDEPRHQRFRSSLYPITRDSLSNK